MTLYNLVRMNTATTGTDDIVVSTAVAGYKDCTDVPNGATVTYSVFNIAGGSPTDSEIGHGTWNSATQTIARTTVLSSTNGNAKIVLTGTGQVALTVAAEDVDSKVNDTGETMTGTLEISVADNTKAVILSDDSSVEWLSAKRVGDVVTLDLPSTEPSNELLNPTFDTDLTNWSEVPAYTLNDQFITDRAAGAVNGTSAEPTGGTRTVVDTNSKLSISGGQLVMDSGAGIPSISWASLSRTAGKVLTVNASTITNDIYFGFGTTATALPTRHSFRIRPASPNISSYENSVTNNLGTIVSGTSYQYAVVLRSTGAYYYIKGGIYTNWTLIWIGSEVNTATLYPIFYQNAGGLTADNIRIPTSTWLPTPLAYDTFTRSDGAIGSTEADSPDGTTLPAHAAPVLAWTNQVGTVEVASNKAVATALSGGRAICTFPSGSADVLHSAAFIRGTTGVGIVLRYVDTSNYVYAKRVATNVVIIKNISGSETTLATVAATEVSSAVLLGIFYGTKLRTYYNKALLGSEMTISDAAIQSEDQMGLIFFDTDSTADLVTTFNRDGFADAPFEELTATRDTGTKYAGAASVKLVAGGTDGNYLQSVNVGDTSSYTFIAYAYTDGSAVTSADLELYYDGAVLSTTFTSMGGGWYKLTGSLTGVASAKDFGVRVKAGVTVYCDSFSLQVGSGDTITLKILNSGTGLLLLQLADGLPEYADNSAAISGGLSAGMAYRTGDTMKIVH